MWIPGQTNLIDLLTKASIPLSQALQLSMFFGELSISFKESIDRDYTTYWMYQPKKRRGIRKIYYSIYQFVYSVFCSNKHTLMDVIFMLNTFVFKILSSFMIKMRCNIFPVNCIRPVEVDSKCLYCMYNTHFCNLPGS